MDRFDHILAQLSLVWHFMVGKEMGEIWKFKMDGYLKVQNVCGTFLPPVSIMAFWLTYLQVLAIVITVWVNHTC